MARNATKRRTLVGLQHPNGEQFLAATTRSHRSRQAAHIFVGGLSRCARFMSRQQTSGPLACSVQIRVIADCGGCDVSHQASYRRLSERLRNVARAAVVGKQRDEVAARNCSPAGDNILRRSLEFLQDPVDIDAFRAFHAGERPRLVIPRVHALRVVDDDFLVGDRRDVPEPG